MAQFDVHRNRSAHRETIPYVVVVQSAFDGYKRRVVVPLVKKSSIDKITLPCFNPTFTIEGTPVVLHPLEIGSSVSAASASEGVSAYAMACASPNCAFVQWIICSKAASAAADNRTVHRRTRPLTAWQPVGQSSG
jgi:hypothetical protein